MSADLYKVEYITANEAVELMLDGYPWRRETIEGEDGENYTILVIQNPDFQPDNGTDPNVIYRLP